MTIFVVFLFCLGTMIFNHDARKLIIVPVERMTNIMRKLAGFNIYYLLYLLLLLFLYKKGIFSLTFPTFFSPLYNEYIEYFPSTNYKGTIFSLTNGSSDNLQLGKEDELKFIEHMAERMAGNKKNIIKERKKKV